MDDDVDEASGINRKAKVQFKIIRQSYTIAWNDIDNLSLQ